MTETGKSSSLPNRPTSWSRISGVLAARLLLLIVLVLLWEVYARFYGDAALIAAPSQTVDALGKVLGDASVRIAILEALLELTAAFSLAVIVGMAIGILIGITELGRRSLYPIVLLLYAIPQVVVLPLFVLVFGLGPASKIVFGFTHGVLPIIVNTIAGMRSVNPVLTRGIAALGASRAQTIRYVVFPNMAATVFTGLRLAMTLTLLGVILAELYVSSRGIGHFTELYTNSLTPAPLFALIAVLAFMAVALNELVRLAETRLTRWKK